MECNDKDRITSRITVIPFARTTFQTDFEVEEKKLRNNGACGRQWVPSGWILSRISIIYLLKSAKIWNAVTHSRLKKLLYKKLISLLSPPHSATIARRKNFSFFYLRRIDDNRRLYIMEKICVPRNHYRKFHVCCFLFFPFFSTHCWRCRAVQVCNRANTQLHKLLAAKWVRPRYAEKVFIIDHTSKSRLINNQRV